MGGAAVAWFALTAEELAALAAVHVTTARRWLRRRQAPHLVERTLGFLRAGELAPLSSTWSGWCVRGEHLIAPSGDMFTPGAVLAGPLELATIHAQRRELDELRAVIAGVDQEAALEELEHALREALSYLAICPRVAPGARAGAAVARGAAPRSTGGRARASAPSA